MAAHGGRREVDGGWRLNGRKIFGTLSPAADLLIVVSRFRRDGDSDDDWGWAYAFVPKDSDGVTLHDDWDALGMRASGSQSITFSDCFVPDELFNTQPRPWGGFDEGQLDDPDHRQPRPERRHGRHRGAGP